MTNLLDQNEPLAALKALPPEELPRVAEELPVEDRPLGAQVGRRPAVRQQGQDRGLVRCAVIAEFEFFGGHGSSARRAIAWQPIMVSRARIRMHDDWLPRHGGAGRSSQKIQAASQYPHPLEAKS